MNHGHKVALRYEVASARDDWALSEETVPESQPHDQTVELIKATLDHWAVGRDVHIARNLAVRWEESRPSIGVDPDVCVLSPAPRDADELESLCTWKPGCAPPILSIEVVSPSNSKKDYVSGPERHAASGAGELWIFDGRLVGPRVRGGPYRLQVWTREADGALSRRYAGEGPAWSPTLGAWLFAVHEGRRLRIADDEQGTKFWPTLAEAERAAKEAALARVAELEAELRRRE